jgi:cytochrome c-type protein NapB
MKKMIKVVALGSLLASSTLFAASTAACLGCHGASFEKVAMGKSKVVKDMSKEDIVKALKGYKDGSYGGAMKGLMKGQVVNLDDAAIEALAAAIKGAPAAATPAAAPKADAKADAAPKAAAKIIDLNKAVDTPERLAEDDLGNKKVITESRLGLRKTDIYSEGDDTTGMKTNYSSDAPGTSTRLERAFQDAPPMIPHSVEGLLPIKAGNNQCVGCHMPEVASSMGATPIPKSHFTDFRPKHKVVDGTFKKTIDNYKNETAISKPQDTLVQARFNCTQCHAPQSKGDLAVSNTFEGGFSADDGKTGSTWYEHMSDDLATVGEGNSVVTKEDIANKNSPAGASAWSKH